MTLAEYIAGIETMTKQPIPDPSPRRDKLAERYAEVVAAVQNRTPNLLEQGIQYTDNRVTRQLFTSLTGLTLPKTQRDTLAVLTAYIGTERVAEHQRQKEQAEADAKAERDRKRIWYIVERFRSGETITGDELIDVSRWLGAEIHPRTVGMLRDKVRFIRKDGTANVKPGTRLPGNTLWPLINLVVAGTDEPVATTAQEATV